jgi:hypothetical protein
MFDANMSSYVVVTAEGSDVYAIQPRAVDVDLTLDLIERTLISLGKSAIVQLLDPVHIS